MMLKRKLINIIKKVKFVFRLKIFFKLKTECCGYNVYGYVSRVMGQGEVVRAYVEQLITDEQNFALVDFLDVNHDSIDDNEELKYKKYYSRKLKYKNNIFFIDLFKLKKFKQQFPSFFVNKNNIAVFWWEYESGFEDRIEILNDFDEVYVFSDFIKNTLDKIKNKSFKINKMPYPFKCNWIIEKSPEEVRADYCLFDKFCFFFNFDYTSSYYRKNPEAILKAFSEEFPENEDVILVFKINNSTAYHKQDTSFRSLISEFRLTNRVLIIKETLTRNSFMTLLNAMDCYISLHRGEGLGLGILEAFSLGKHVIATNYGGNTEYMLNELACPVNYSLVPPPDYDDIAHKKVKLWAEPDIAHARICMRQVFLKYYKNRI